MNIFVIIGLLIIIFVIVIFARDKIYNIRTKKRFLRNQICNYFNKLINHLENKNLDKNIIEACIFDIKKSAQRQNIKSKDFFNIIAHLHYLEKENVKEIINDIEIFMRGLHK